MKLMGMKRQVYLRSVSNCPKRSLHSSAEAGLGGGVPEALCPFVRIRRLISVVVVVVVVVVAVLEVVARPMVASPGVPKEGVRHVRHQWRVIARYEELRLLPEVVRFALPHVEVARPRCVRLDCQLQAGGVAVAEPL